MKRIIILLTCLLTILSGCSNEESFDIEDGGRISNPITKVTILQKRKASLPNKVKTCDETRATALREAFNGNSEHILGYSYKVAYSHLIDVLDEDWLLDEYGIRTWVESLPTRKISMASLANSYQIIGL